MRWPLERVWITRIWSWSSLLSRINVDSLGLDWSSSYEMTIQDLLQSSTSCATRREIPIDVLSQYSDRRQISLMNG